MNEPIDHRHARSALHAIDPGCSRDEWHRIGRAAIAAGLTVDDLDEWSSTAPNYSGAKDVRAAFRGVSAEGGTGPGTLWRLAMDAGWMPPSDNDEANPMPRQKAKPDQKSDIGRRTASAAEVWARLQPATLEHGYIASKRGLPDGLRVVPAGDPLRIAGASMAGWLVVPVLPWSGGEPTSLQFVPPPGHGKKLNLPAARMDGAFVVGELEPEGTAYLCEGIGQAWTCWQATGHAAVVCFGWGRVRTVAAELRERDAGLRLVVVPDVGKEGKATEIAREVGAFVAAMPEGWPINADVNDLAQRDGYDVLEVLLQGANAPPATEPEPSPTALLKDVDIAQLLHAEPAPAVWWWSGYIPADHVTMAGGHGGAGKSTLFAALGACIGVGKPFLGRDTKRGRVLFFSGEDPAGLVAVRLARICRVLNIDPTELQENFRLIDATEGDPALFTERRIDGTRTGLTTPTYAALAQYIETHQIDVLIADNASDVYDADEINRPLVRGFIRSLARLIRERGGAVVLLAHVDKGTSRGRGDAGSENYSGSTAWHNSVRSRLFLAEREPGQLELLHQKCNLGPKLPPLMLAWPHDGIPQLDIPAGGMVAHIAERVDLASTLKLIHQFYERGEHIGTDPRSRYNAVATLKDEPSFPKRRKPAEVFSSLRDAEQRGLICREVYRDRYRREAERWKLTSKGLETIGLAASAASAASTVVAAPTHTAQAAAASAASALLGGVGDSCAHTPADLRDASSLERAP